MPVRDTQCGFKMLRAEPAKRLFDLSKEQGYLFDLEILALALRCGYRVTEVPSSQLKMHREAGKIERGLWRVRRRVGRIDLNARDLDEKE